MGVCDSRLSAVPSKNLGSSFRTRRSLCAALSCLAAPCDGTYDPERKDARLVSLPHGLLPSGGGKSSLREGVAQQLGAGDVRRQHREAGELRAAFGKCRSLILTSTDAIQGTGARQDVPPVLKGGT